MASIQFCGVSKAYHGVARAAGEEGERGGLISQRSRQFRALVEIDLEVQQGELLVLMGPSGSGKTTLLRLIAGLEPPTSGSVRFDGRDQHGVAVRERNTAMVFQGLSLYGHLTARENIAFGLRMRSRRGFLSRWLRADKEVGEDVERAVRSVAQRLGIEALLEKRPGELSGGEQQRVAIARALVRQPRVLLLDEPLASLDGPTRLTLRRELKHLQQRLGTTTVYVTHDQGEALALGDRIGVLLQGRLQQVGTPEVVFRQPANRWVASLFGQLGMSFVSGSIEKSMPGREREGSYGWRCGRWWSPLPEPIGRMAERGELTKAVLGVRPDDVTIASQPEEWPQWAGEACGMEYQGEATYALVRQIEGEAGGQPSMILARLTNGRLKPGETVLVQLNPEKVCWFDSDSGVNLGIKATG